MECSKDGTLSALCICSEVECALQMPMLIIIFITTFSTWHHYNHYQDKIFFNVKTWTKLCFYRISKLTHHVLVSGTDICSFPRVCMPASVWKLCIGENGIMSVFSPPKTNTHTQEIYFCLNYEKSINKDSKKTTTRYFKYFQYLQMRLKAIKHLLLCLANGQTSF